ncbi:AraC family transcriptional regulator [uncultured Zhongshania sp.]|uniref:AraC family transcriptional regulator n=1 Tax=uncultured Zhongshania sp. TaxID=1642288 RepID=UPI0030DCE368
MNKNVESAPTTIAAYGLAIKSALEANGYDTKDIFEKIGINQLPSNVPQERLTTSQVAALFEQSVKLTGNPAFGLTVARFMHPSTLHALGYALLASASIRDSAERAVNYFRLVSGQAEIQINEDDEYFRISTHLLTDGVAPESIDAWNAFLIRLFRLIYKPDFAPAKVQLQRPQPLGCEEQYLKSFHVPVKFNAEFSEICIDRFCVDVPVTGGNREIAQQHDHVIEGYLAKLDDADIISKTRSLIVRNLASGNCDKQRIASELHMSPSHLQMKLSKLDTTFQDLLNQVRKSLALTYVENANVSLTEITFLLGFSDTSSFTRAFRRWTEKSPTEYRRNLGIDH